MTAQPAGVGFHQHNTRKRCELYSAVQDSVHEVTGLTVTGEQADQIAAACCGLVVQLSKIWVSWFRGVWWWVQKFSWPEEWRWRRCGLYASSSALVCGRHLG